MKFWKGRWKIRAINRRIEIRKLKKRLKELTDSRDLWKNKAQNSKELINELEEELKKNSE